MPFPQGEERGTPPSEQGLLLLNSLGGFRVFPLGGVRGLSLPWQPPPYSWGNVRGRGGSEQSCLAASPLGLCLLPPPRPSARAGPPQCFGFLQGPRLLLPSTHRQRLPLLNVWQDPPPQPPCGAETPLLGSGRGGPCSCRLSISSSLGAGALHHLPLALLGALGGAPSSFLLPRL